jgi:exosortase E/protease (VPEID-CTERM system)
VPGFSPGGPKQRRAGKKITVFAHDPDDRANSVAKTPAVRRLVLRTVQFMCDTSFSTPAVIPAYRLGVSARLAILGVVLLTEKIFLNAFVDFDRAQAARGLGAIVRIAQHLGFRFLVAFAAAVALFAYVRGGQRVTTAAETIRAAPLRIGWMFGHVLLVVPLAPLSYLLYRYTVTELSLAAIVALWTAFAAAAALAALFALAPRSLWLGAVRALGMIWWYAMAAALLGTGATQLSQSLWAPTAALTFDLVRRLLAPIIPTLTADPSTLVLATDRFAVQVADVCSGLEGVGLMLAFSVAWLLYFRREYILPRALILIPAGILAIFALNVLRIAVLILIGDAGLRDVAVYGFHSQAGWIAFIAVACGMVQLSRRSTWLNRSAMHSNASPAMDNPTAAYLMPLLAILAAGAVARAISGGFEFFYPLCVVAGLLMLARYRQKLATIDWHWSWRGPAVGVLVFLVWIVAAHFLLPESAMPEKLAAVPAALRGFWIVSRVAGSILIVPIAEELAYRGYLMRRLAASDFESVPFQSVRWPALTATAIAFGLAHGALWLPGIAAGLAYGLILVRRGRIGEAVAAHATTNALIAASVLGWNQWQLW